MENRLTIEKRLELVKTDIENKYATMYICVKTESPKEYNKVNEELTKLKCKYFATVNPEHISEMAKFI
jgi:hypothetical protein